MNSKKVLWITETAILTALLIILQYTTASAGQLITGSCVNAVLAFAAMTVGISSAAAIAVLSPFFAFIFGIGPKLIPIVPCISIGNLVYVVVIAIVAGKAGNKTRGAVAIGAGAALKFITLYTLVAKFICTTLALKPQQIAMFTKMFSWPQLVTALVGGVIAFLIAQPVQRARYNRKKDREEREKENEADKEI